MSLSFLFNYMFDKNNHHLKLMGGYSYQYFENSGFNAENKNFASDLLSYNNLGAGSYLRLAASIGLPAAHTSFVSFGAESAVVIERYDRVTGDDGSVTRIHQEDLCQALCAQ